MALYSSRILDGERGAERAVAGGGEFGWRRFAFGPGRTETVSVRSPIFYSATEVAAVEGAAMLARLSFEGAKTITVLRW
jgi:hypothetical protein